MQAALRELTGLAGTAAALMHMLRVRVQKNQTHTHTRTAAVASGGEPVWGAVARQVAGEVVALVAQVCVCVCVYARARERERWGRGGRGRCVCGGGA